MILDQEFSKNVILDYVTTNVMDYVSDENYLNDTFNDLFNSEPWIIGRFEASNALNNFDGYEHETSLDGVFGAIEFVTNCSEDEGLEINYSDLADPEKLASLVAYYEGKKVFNEILDKTGLDMDDMASRKNLEKIKKEAFKMMKEGQN